MEVYQMEVYVSREPFVLEIVSISSTIRPTTVHIWVVPTL